MKHQDIKYVAFEGGGGKGIVYLGAIRALEVVHKLPLSKSNRSAYPNDVLCGISGASAGAITSYFLSLGMSADDIEAKTNEKDDHGKPRFFSFYDDAQPGLYKGVTYYPESGNLPEFIVDVPQMEYIAREDDTGSMVPVPTSIKSLKTGKPYTDRKLAETQAERLYGFYRLFYPIEFAKLLLRALTARRRLKKWAASNQVAEKLAEKPSHLNRYLYGLLFDRGLFSGIYIRDYLHELTVEQLDKHFGVKMRVDDAARLTFEQFFNHTENDLRISVTNVTKALPVYFSKELTPDFPIVDAICMSMSIPLAFKPTLSQAWADTERAYESAHNERYRGFFSDGGVVNNLPIHAFDFSGDEDNYMKKVVALNGQMFGIRCTGGNPTDPTEDDRFSLDPNYIYYAQKDRPPGDLRMPKPNTPYQIEMISGPVTPILEFTGNVLSALMYYQEDGQIRSEDEFKQIMELFSYDVGLFDFAVPKSLSHFVQARAAIKVGAMIDVDQAALRAQVVEKYYAIPLNVFPVDWYIDYTYERVRKYKQEHKIP